MSEENNNDKSLLVVNTSSNHMVINSAADYIAVVAKLYSDKAQEKDPEKQKEIVQKIHDVKEAGKLVKVNLSELEDAIAFMTQTILGVVKQENYTYNLKLNTVVRALGNGRALSTARIDQLNHDLEDIDKKKGNN